MAERIPPGRAGRLWLTGRLDAARRGRELLDRKRQLLQREQRRLSLLVDDRRHSWDDAATAAARWALRAGVFGGALETAMVAGGIAGTAAVTIAWRNTMGVQHPDSADAHLPELPPAEVAAANPALGPAAEAHRGALLAAVDLAVAAAALQRIESELALTQSRLRGIERHRIPALEAALHALQLRLEESEREERVVTRWAERRRKGSR